MSKLTREECTALFKQMADSKELIQRYRELHRILGQGVWMMHGSTGDQLKVMKPTMAIYVPMDSISMFFLSQTLMVERVDPAKEMLLALHYGGGGQGSYLWAKVTIPTPSQNAIPKPTTPASRRTPAQVPMPKARVGAASTRPMPSTRSPLMPRPPPSRRRP